MSEYEETSGKFTFVAGMVALILVAVCGSMLINQRFQESKNYRELERKIQRGIDEIEGLQLLRTRINLQLMQVESPRTQMAQDWKLTQRQLELANQRKIALTQQRSSLDNQLKSLQNEFTNYRERYRKMIWYRAEGESLGDFKTSDGRVLLKATISKVTHSGIEIRHQDGFAKIPVESLSPVLRSRFQWENNSHAP